MWAGLALKAGILLAVFIAGLFAGEARCSNRARKEAEARGAATVKAINQDDKDQADGGKIAREVIRQTKEAISEAVGQKPSEEHGSACWTISDSIELRDFHSSLFKNKVQAGPDLDGG